MVLIVVGLVVLAAGVHFMRKTALPADGIEVEGTVTDLEIRKSRISGNPSMLYGPTVTYRDPLTGTLVELAPDSLRQTSYEIGQKVTVNYDPSTRMAKLPTTARLARRLMPFGAGLGLIALGVLDLTR